LFNSLLILLSPAPGDTLPKTGVWLPTTSFPTYFFFFIATPYFFYFLPFPSLLGPVRVGE